MIFSRKSSSRSLAAASFRAGSGVSSRLLEMLKREELCLRSFRMWLGPEYLSLLIWAGGGGFSVPPGEVGFSAPPDSPPSSPLLGEPGLVFWGLDPSSSLAVGMAIHVLRTRDVNDSFCLGGYMRS